MSKEGKKKKDSRPDFLRRLKQGREYVSGTDEAKPTVCEVFPLRDYWLLLFFSNGEIRLYDCAWVLKLSSMERLNKKGFLRKAQAVNGTVKWNKSIALQADELYGNSTPLTDNGGKLLQLL